MFLAAFFFFSEVYPKIVFGTKTHMSSHMQQEMDSVADIHQVGLHLGKGKYFQIPPCLNCVTGFLWADYYQHFPSFLLFVSFLL